MSDDLRALSEAARMHALVLASGRGECPVGNPDTEDCRDYYDVRLEACNACTWAISVSTNDAYRFVIDSIADGSLITREEADAEKRVLEDALEAACKVSEWLARAQRNCESCHYQEPHLYTKCGGDSRKCADMWLTAAREAVEGER